MTLAEEVGKLPLRVYKGAHVLQKVYLQCIRKLTQFDSQDGDVLMHLGDLHMLILGVDLFIFVFYFDQLNEYHNFSLLLLIS